MIDKLKNATKDSEIIELLLDFIDNGDFQDEEIVNYLHSRPDIIKILKSLKSTHSFPGVLKKIDDFNRENFSELVPKDSNSLNERMNLIKNKI
jgi:hypothetical protein